jgi:hypothetical protein
MIVSRKPYNGNEYVNLDTHNFEIAKHYTYLGTILTYKNEVRQEIEKKYVYKYNILWTSSCTKESIAFRA